MKTLIVLSLLLAFANANRICDGTCVQGEGDCDRDSDCLPGLKCEFDWWWGTDVCHAGPTTRNFTWTEFGDWGKCIGSFCGAEQAGVRTRSRDCVPPVDGGFDCPSQTDEEQEACDMPECPYTDWGEWGICSGELCGGAGTNARTRDCIPADDGSFGCPVPNEEEQGTCDMPECQFTEWGDWSICSGQLCGGAGTNARTRDCIPADDGSFGCPVPNEEEQGTCDMPECQFTEWGDWSICSGQLCGGAGINARTRDCIPADDGSFGCPVPNEEEQGTCDMPECQFTEWGEWSVCSGELCGGAGTNTRTRDCIPADDGSFGCPVPNEEEQGTCDMPECNWSEWGVWTECGGAECGETGSMSRARDCVPPEDGSYGCPVPNEEEQDSCNMPECNCFCPAP